jgi:hypothetical protein
MKDGVFLAAEQKTLAFSMNVFVILDQGFLISIHDNAERIHHFVYCSLRDAKAGIQG